MANNDIIIRTTQSFKTPELNNAVKSFDKFFSGINKNWRDACILMFRLSGKDSYEADGFKSFADFAETIGIAKSTAHHMADAGRVYDSKIPAIAQFADKAGYTKASKVASIVKEGKESDLAKAIENGEIKPNDSVSEIASWKATKQLQSKAEKVLPKFEVFGVHGNGNKFHYDAVELENVKELAKAIKAGVVELPGIKAGIVELPGIKWTVYVNAETGDMLRIRTEKVKKEAKPAKKVKKSLDDMTPEEFQAWASERGMTITFTNVTEK